VTLGEAPKTTKATDRGSPAGSGQARPAARGLNQPKIAYIRLFQSEQLQK